MKRVYDMSFAEFQLRLSAYKRIQQREWEKVRILAWYSATGPHLNAKKLPKTLNQFMHLDIDDLKNNELSESQIQSFKNAMEEYLKNAK